MTTQALGQGGFRWFIGKVVSRDDPLKLGRVRLRVIGVHDSETDAPDDTLPWGTFINPPQSASSTEIGISPTGIMVGSVVVGFFVDGTEGQQPLIFGTIAAIPGLDTLQSDITPESYASSADAVHDVSKIARGITPNHVTEKKDSTRVQDVHVTEPAHEFSAVYPYNKVTQSESGHVIEIDDTQGKERLHFYHKSGTYAELRADGTKIDKIQKDNYTIITNNDDVYIGGTCNIKILGNAILNVEGSVTANVKSDVTLHSGSNILVTALDGTITMKAKLIQLNPDTSGTSTGPGGPGVPGSGKSRFAGWENPNKKYYREFG